MKRILLLLASASFLGCSDPPQAASPPVVAAVVEKPDTRLVDSQRRYERLLRTAKDVDRQWSEFNRLSQVNSNAYQKYSEGVATINGGADIGIEAMRAIGADQRHIDVLRERADKSLQSVKDHLGPPVDAALKAVNDQMDRLERARSELEQFK